MQAELVLARLSGPDASEASVRRLAGAGGGWISTVAELLITSPSVGGAFVRAVIHEEAGARPDRWLALLRRALVDGDRASKAFAADLVDSIGEASDVRALRDYSRQSKSTVHVGRMLARRVAERVTVLDLGRVNVKIGQRLVQGGSTRRKVLALLCFLITRPGMSAARDQVVDALWPEQDPGAAANSLNQTVYFLRRVFEPKYHDDLSPGYLRHESDLLWLDQDLVGAESATCRQAIAEARRSSDWEAVDLVSHTYRARFALDFEYEEWAEDYRDNLHAAYLEVIEAAVGDEVRAARFDRAIDLCRRALDVDPGSEPIERQLLRLYRATGSHAAAEEQYRHYASVMREDFGVNPPPLSEV